VLGRSRFFGRPPSYGTVTVIVPTLAVKVPEFACTTTLMVLDWGGGGGGGGGGPLPPELPPPHEASRRINSSTTTARAQNSAGRGGRFLFFMNGTRQTMVAKYGAAIHSLNCQCDEDTCLRAAGATAGLDWTVRVRLVLTEPLAGSAVWLGLN